VLSTAAPDVDFIEKVEEDPGSTATEGPGASRSILEC